MAADALINRGDGPVRVLRSVTEEPLECFVVGVGRTWALLRVVTDAATLDGYSLVRVAHVTDVQPRGPSERFVRRSLELRGAWPPSAPARPSRLHRTGDVMADLIDLAAPIAVHIEAEDPDVLFVGVPFRNTARSLGLREIDSAGRWLAEESHWAFSRLTRVDFGTVYVTRLLEVANLGEDDAADNPG